MMETLKYGIVDRSLFEIEFHNFELNILLHHKNDWFEMIDKILDFEPKGRLSQLNRSHWNYTFH